MNRSRVSSVFGNGRLFRRDPVTAAVTRLGSVYSPSPCSITVTHAPLQAVTRQNLLDWHHYDTLTLRRQSPTWMESRLAASRRCLLLSQSLVATFRRYFPLTRSVLAGNHRVHWSRACEFLSNGHLFPPGPVTLTVTRLKKPFINATRESDLLATLRRCLLPWMRSRFWRRLRIHTSFRLKNTATLALSLRCSFLGHPRFPTGNSGRAIASKSGGDSRRNLANSIASSLHAQTLRPQSGAMDAVTHRAQRLTTILPVGGNQRTVRLLDHVGGAIRPVPPTAIMVGTSRLILQHPSRTFGVGTTNGHLATRPTAGNHGMQRNRRWRPDLNRDLSSPIR